MVYKYIPIKNKRILALDPAYQGLGYALIEDHAVRLIDWGIKKCRPNKNRIYLQKAEELFTRHKPDVLVVENVEGNTRRCRRVRKLIQEITKLAAKKKIEVRTFSREQVKKAFANTHATNKEEIAQVIAGFFPELAPRLPRHREIWMSEDYTMSIFDAMALGMTYFHSAK